LVDVKKEKIKRRRDKEGSKKHTWNNKPKRKKNKSLEVRKCERQKGK
jgi:hypothetical protein